MSFFSFAHLLVYKCEDRLTSNSICNFCINMSSTCGFQHVITSLSSSWVNNKALLLLFHTAGDYHICVPLKSSSSQMNSGVCPLNLRTVSYICTVAALIDIEVAKFISQLVTTFNSYFNTH